MHDHAPRLALPGGVAQRRERDAQLGCPGGVADRGASVPGEVGREVVGIVAERELRLVEHAIRLDGAGRDAKDGPHAAVPPRVEHQGDVIVAGADFVAVGVGGTHAGGVGVLRPDADVERMRVVRDRHHSAHRGRDVVGGPGLVERRQPGGVGPGRIVEPAVERNGPGHVWNGERQGIARLGLREEARRGRQGQRDTC